ncbi:phage protein, partial [Xanthomonas perforans]
MTLDTYDRVDLTGPWAGFGFQGHRFFTPEGRDIDPVGMR